MAYGDEYDPQEQMPKTWADVTPEMWAKVYGYLTGFPVDSSALGNQRVRNWIQGQITNQVTPHAIAEKMKMPDYRPPNGTGNVHNTPYTGGGYKNLWEELTRGGLGDSTTTDTPGAFYNTGYNFNPLGYGGKLRV